MEMKGGNREKASCRSPQLEETKPASRSFSRIPKCVLIKVTMGPKSYQEDNHVVTKSKCILPTPLI